MISPPRLPPARHETKILVVAIVFMALIAVPRMALETYVALFHTGTQGAIDLLKLKAAVLAVASGVPIYGVPGSEVYPPATYVLTWPLVGWGSAEFTRWVWTGTSYALLACLAFVLIDAIGLERGVRKAFLWVFLLAAYPTSLTIGTGQLTFFSLVPFLGAVLLLRSAEGSPHRVLAASLLLCLALAKPHVTAPLYVVLLVAGSWTLAWVLAGVWYLGATWIGALMIGTGLLGLIPAWTARVETVADWAPVYWSAYKLVTALGHPEWALPASLLLLLALTVWVLFHRDRDVWTLLGVAAIVAREWTYHRPYDDLLLFLPMVALTRIAIDPTTSHRGRGVAAWLLFLFWGTLLWPMDVAHRFPDPYPSVLFGSQFAIWMGGLLFLLAHARRRPTGRVRAERAVGET